MSPSDLRVNSWTALITHTTNTKHALVIDHRAIPNGAANAVDPDIYSQK